ncbi:hypothetical protein J3F84DRAFT_397711 [Trichoderma pleuroticola]
MLLLRTLSSAVVLALAASSKRIILSGIAIPGVVLNATKTPACSSVLDEEMSIIFDISVKFEALINEATFDIWPLNTSNVTVIVSTLQSDFGNVNVENQFQFHTGTDGLGPYHINVSSNGAKYQFLEVSVRIPSGNTSLPRQSRSSAFFLDSLVLENID